MQRTPLKRPNADEPTLEEQSEGKKAKIACRHTCKVCKPLARGGGQNGHEKNPRLHPNCANDCPKYKSLQKEKTSDGQANPTVCRAIFVLDPRSGVKTINEASGSFNFTRHAGLAKAKSLLKQYPELDKYVKTDSSRKEGHILDWIIACEDAQSEELSFRYKTFESFVEPFEQEGVSVEMLCRQAASEYDIVVANLGENLLERYPDEAECAKIMMRLRAVEQEVPFWPSLDENLRESNKLAVIRDLDIVAQKVTNTARPSSSEGGFDDKSKVHKRSASAYGKHVYTPDENVDFMQYETTNSQIYWFTQDYAPLLRKIGEVRVFVSGGKKILGRIATTPSPNNLESLDASEFTRCQLLSATTAENASFENDSVLQNSNEGMKELDKFVKDTLKGMVKLEEGRLRHKPTIADIAQLDIGIMETAAGGEYHYFVNELTRVPCCTLFHKIKATVLDDVAEILRECALRTVKSHRGSLRLAIQE